MKIISPGILQLVSIVVNNFNFSSLPPEYLVFKGLDNYRKHIKFGEASKYFSSSAAGVTQFKANARVGI